MGQGQSQASTSGGRTLGDTQPRTSQEGLQDEQSNVVSAEQARLDRERRAEAAQQRVNEMQKKKQQRSAAVGASTAAPKKKTALEELSAENRGWRAADEQADLRAWN
ncbi:unnamed protein product [Periconia digitata]|uniref:Uncharacterized protein n=1 Tax=Periconia digitata TaxID=1303443 RepID=A0A9W4U886_9PLEO|nr:unnamed protein product [Periconia digitata]